MTRRRGGGDGSGSDNPSPDPAPPEVGDPLQGPATRATVAWSPSVRADLTEGPAPSPTRKSRQTQRVGEAGERTDSSRSTLPQFERVESELAAADLQEMLGESQVALPPVEAPVDGGNKRYALLGLLGEGGMAEVWRVFDRDLNREVAMKVLRSKFEADLEFIVRFVQEAQTVAQLQHPNLVPVHDIGRLDDGRFFFTMVLVEGRTLTDIIKEVHAATGDGGEGITEDGWNLRRLVEAFLAVCNGMAHAHSRGVVHRDLKPDNVVIGEHGEVQVLDWGIAKVVGRPGLDEDSGRLVNAWDSHHRLTQAGTISGTPEYMSPEQAMGRNDEVGVWSDVYSLGGMLYQILSGQPPYHGKTVREVLKKVAEGQAKPLPELSSDLRLPEDLVAIQQRAMSLLVENRHRDASEVALEVRTWLDGRRRRELADGLVDGAAAAARVAGSLERSSEELREDAEAILRLVPSWAAEEQKRPGWSLEDQAEALQNDAEQGRSRALEKLQLALLHCPTHEGAHIALAHHFQGEHAKAESRGDREGASRSASSLRLHADVLSPSHPHRLQVESYLRGVGTVSLASDPPGAQVEWYRYRVQGRRLVETFEKVLGETPLQRVELPIGRHLLVLKREGAPDVRYPVSLAREQHWDGARPGAGGPVSSLPLPSELSPDDVYVPAGWFLFGGDEQASNACSGRRLWLDGFLVKRVQVTHQEYLAFLNDLLLTDREEEAASRLPRVGQGRGQGAGGNRLYERDARGLFRLPLDAADRGLGLALPVGGVSYFDASAFAAWTAEKDGLPWRLPSELEWEKAARGVDGRFFPWGDFLDHSWCCMRSSRDTRVGPVAASAYPVDRSPYGVLGMSGNMRDWCLDPFREEVPWQDGDVVELGEVLAEAEQEDLGDRVVRGGSWMSFDANCRVAFRYIASPGFYGADGSFRLARFWRSPEASGD